ncbi:hypothetical protein PQX77_014475 [Marasmius sp. AFHP31]|nr:hypothetical protein PQX77_014475 [Marasmius sp. AFHP31]
MSSTLGYVLAYSFSEDSSLITTITLAGNSTSTPDFEVTTPARGDNPTIVRKHGVEVGSFDGKAKEGCSVNGRVVERAKGGTSFVLLDGKKYTWRIHQWRKKIDLTADETRTVIATFSSSAPKAKAKKPEDTPPALHISPPTGSESGMIDEIITTLFYVRQHGARGVSSSPGAFDLMSESH